MPKILALQFPAARLAGLLAEKGYKVISLQDARRFRAHVDAVLYSGHRPETLPSCQDESLAADISLGCNASDDPAAETLMLNITGMSAPQIAAELEYRLQHRSFRP